MFKRKQSPRQNECESFYLVLLSNAQSVANANSFHSDVLWFFKSSGGHLSENARSPLTGSRPTQLNQHTRKHAESMHAATTSASKATAAAAIQFVQSCWAGRSRAFPKAQSLSHIPQLYFPPTPARPPILHNWEKLIYRAFVDALVHHFACMHARCVQMFVCAASVRVSFDPVRVCVCVSLWGA